MALAAILYDYYIVSCKYSYIRQDTKLTHTVRLVPRMNWKGLANIGQNVDYMSSNYLGHYNNVPLILSHFVPSLFIYFEQELESFQYGCHVGIISVIMRRITRQIDKEENGQLENRNHNYPTIFDTCRKINGLTSTKMCQLKSIILFCHNWNIEPFQNVEDIIVYFIHITNKWFENIGQFVYDYN